MALPPASFPMAYRTPPAALTATNFDPGAYPNLGQINSPPPFTVPNNGRPPRFLQTTFGIEREVVKDLSVEASFIDNRGVWLESDGLRVIQPTPSIGPLRSTVWTLPTRLTQALLTQPISSPSRHGERLHEAVRHLPVRSDLGSGITAIPAIRQDRLTIRARWQYLVRRASSQGHQADRQRTVGRPRLLLVEGSGNGLQHRDLHHGDTDTGSHPVAQESEILSGHRPAADAELLLQL